MTTAKKKSISVLAWEKKLKKRKHVGITSQSTIKHMCTLCPDIPQKYMQGILHHLNDYISSNLMTGKKISFPNVCTIFLRTKLKKMSSFFSSDSSLKSKRIYQICARKSEVFVDKIKKI